MASLKKLLERSAPIDTKEDSKSEIRSSDNVNSKRRSLKLLLERSSSSEEENSTTDSISEMRSTDKDNEDVDEKLDLKNRLEALEAKNVKLEDELIEMRETISAMKEEKAAQSAAFDELKESVVTLNDLEGILENMGGQDDGRKAEKNTDGFVHSKKRKDPEHVSGGPNGCDDSTKCNKRKNYLLEATSPPSSTASHSRDDDVSDDENFDALAKVGSTSGDCSTNTCTSVGERNRSTTLVDSSREASVSGDGMIPLNTVVDSAEETLVEVKKGVFILSTSKNDSTEAKISREDGSGSVSCKNCKNQLSEKTTSPSPSNGPSSDDFSHLLPNNVIGGELNGPKSPANDPYTHHCPWCNVDLELENNANVDLLSDLHGMEEPDRNKLIVHENQSNCMFWGLRISRMHKCVNDVCTPRILLYKCLTNCMYKSRRKTQSLAWIKLEDTESKDAVKDKINEIMAIAKVGAEEWSSDDLTPLSLKYLEWLHRYYTNGPPPPNRKSNWVRNILYYLLSKMMVMMLERVDQWAEPSWNADKLRLINDLNLSLFCYEYFWYSSVFYTCLDMDKLVPFRDTEKEVQYRKRWEDKKAVKSSVKVIKGDYGNPDVLFLYRQSSFPGPGTVGGHTEVKTHRGLVYLPIEVATSYPFWAQITKLPDRRVRLGFKCARVGCFGGVQCLKNTCPKCRHVYCRRDREHFTLVNEKLVCLGCAKLVPAAT